MKLYEIASDMRAVYEAMAEAPLEDMHVLEQAEEALQRSFADKADAIGCLRAEWLGQAEYFKAEKDRLAAMQKAAENRAERIQEFLLKSMKSLNITAIRTAHFPNLKIRLATRPSIRWVGPGLVPLEFQKPPRDPELDGDYAYSQFRNGSRLPDGFQATYSEWIQFK